MLRVVLSGVESVGKSTLCVHLAAHFGGLSVPEFGRTYTERLRRDLELEDHYAIAEGHEIAADQAAAARPPVLIEDTDIVMTSAWATMLFGERDPILAERESRADLHLLLIPDVPFVSDPVRMFGADEERLRFHRIVVDEFVARGVEFTEIAGDWKARSDLAIATIRAHL
ncbi:AAA family ATPase [Sandaracinobacteroides hominis]|uniref:AAA family ATPase n=1 Tax=Sandaracinobacteroides hominis TaxID=2780086 RepID=UPI0018F7623E|nr:ATP-binding protein [Sandaracinobacteroides hominis]